MNFPASRGLGKNKKTVTFAADSNIEDHTQYSYKSSNDQNTSNTSSSGDCGQGENKLVVYINFCGTKVGFGKQGFGTERAGA